LSLYLRLLHRFVPRLFFALQSLLLLTQRKCLAFKPHLLQLLLLLFTKEIVFRFGVPGGRPRFGQSHQLGRVCRV
jgi:hypothetical protein